MSAYDVSLLREALGENLRFHEELSSTSDEALLLARAGTADGFVVLAERQTAGRGRRGSAWFCEQGGGLAFSLVTQPSLMKALWPRLALVAGLAVAVVLERRRFASEIKWPNDVLIHGRKVCGILAEVEGECVVFGFGVNVTTQQLPQDLSGIATSLALESGEDSTREELLLEIVSELSVLMRLAERDFAAVVAMARERCALSGKLLRYQIGKTEVEGFCEGLGEGGELLIRRNGVVQRVVSAEQIRMV